MANRWGNNGNRERFYFGELQSDCSHEIKRHLLLERKAMIKLDNILRSRDIADIDLSRQSYDFSSSYVWMRVLHYKES